MNWLQVRTQFVKSSGRYDLVQGKTFKDNGADFYIQSGSRLLDLLQDVPHTRKWYHKLIVPGDCVVELTHFRSVEDIWIVDPDSTTDEKSRKPLEEKSLKWIFENYSEPSISYISCVAEVNLTNTVLTIAAQPSVASRLLITIVDTTDSLTAGTITILGEDENSRIVTEVLDCSNGAGIYVSTKAWTVITSITTSLFATLNGAGDETIKVEYPSTEEGKPLYYARIPIGVAPQLERESSGNWAGKSDWSYLHINAGVFSDEEEYEGVLLAPACGGVYTLELLGRFFNEYVVSSDTYTTFWTTRHPDLLVQAALAKLEFLAYQNMTRYRNIKAALRDELLGIDHDLADDEDYSSGQMRSSWME